MSQTERLYWIDSQIRSGGYPNADAVSRQFEVSRRTAFADRDALIERLRAPVVFDRAHGGWTYTDATFMLPFLALSEHEASALRRSLLAAVEYLGPTDADAISIVAERLVGSASASRPRVRESVGGSIRASADISVSAELLDQCEQATAKRRRINILYYGAHRDETTSRIVRPYHLLNYQGEWHLIGWCESRSDIRQFLLSRIREWQVLPEDFAYRIDPDFSAERYLAQGFGTRHGDAPVHIHVRFSAMQSRWVRERLYHPTQRTEKLPDGRLELTMDVAGTAEVARWLRSYGPEVEVIEPPELRQDMIDTAKKVLEIYEQTR